MQAIIPCDIAYIIKNKEHTVVLSGAGISAESGVPTFRGTDGLWSKYRPEELACEQAFLADPELVWSWYQYRRDVIKSVKPHAGHLALASIESLSPQFTLITQNVDGLHVRAGSRRVLELHGNIMVNKCHSCGEETRDEEFRFAGEIPKCRCGGMLRPGVVWFGESLPVDVLEQAITAAGSCDLFISVGTSSIVYPAASLLEIAHEKGAVILEINPETTPHTRLADYHLSGSAGQILPVLADAYKSLHSQTAGD